MFHKMYRAVRDFFWIGLRTVVCAAVLLGLSAIEVQAEKNKVGRKPEVPREPHFLYQFEFAGQKSKTRPAEPAARSPGTVEENKY